MSPRARLIRAVLTVAGWLGPWLIRKLGRLGLARLEAWADGEIDKFKDRARSARKGSLRQRWLLWRARLWRKAMRRMTAEAPHLRDLADDLIDEAADRAAAAGIDRKPDSFAAWRRHHG